MIRKSLVLVQPDTNSYYTGRYWGRILSKDIEEAKIFNSIEELELDLNVSEEENMALHDQLIDMRYLEVKTIYLKQ